MNSPKAANVTDHTFITYGIPNTRSR